MIIQIRSYRIKKNFLYIPCKDPRISAQRASSNLHNILRCNACRTVQLIDIRDSVRFSKHRDDIYNIMQHDVGPLSCHPKFYAIAQIILGRMERGVISNNIHLSIVQFETQLRPNQMEQRCLQQNSLSIVLSSFHDFASYKQFGYRFVVQNRRKNKVRLSCPCQPKPLWTYCASTKYPLAQKAPRTSVPRKLGNCSKHMFGNENII